MLLPSITQARKSLCLCLAGLRVGWFDPIAEVSELPEHSGCALLLRLFADRWAPFFVSNSLVQDQPDQATLTMRDGSDGLCVPKTRYHAAMRRPGLTPERVSCDASCARFRGGASM